MNSAIATGVATMRVPVPLRRRRFHDWVCLFGLAFADIATFLLAEIVFRYGRAVPELVIFGRENAGFVTSGTPVDLFLILAPLFIVARYLAGDYSRRQLFWDGARLTTGALLITAVPDALLFLAGGGHYSAAAFFETWGFMLLALPAFRQMARLALSSVGVWKLPTALVGSGPRAGDLYGALRESLSLGFDVQWLVVDDAEEINDYLKHLKMLFATDPGEIATALSAYGCSQTVVAARDPQSPEIAPIMQRLMENRISVSFVPSLHRLPIVGVTTSYFFGRDLMLFQIRDNLRRFPHRVLKRGFDLVVAPVLLVLLLPLFAFIAIAIKAHDGGNIIYAQKRSGRMGRPFWCLKFRTMLIDADERRARWRDEDPVIFEEFTKAFKLRDDPRVTKPGQWLRRTSLDELPQLVNVIRGDMSLVGPRPVLEAELIEHYGPAAQLYARVRPGLTGLWQISGRSDTTYRERVLYDEWYVLNWSFWYDIVILLQTAWIVALGKGAY